ncbi:MAG: hypothetical protein NTZ56_17880 [Acidobacteria bacterium]|nr:hypothetical protein [Acidobacteriota bacterium]
MVRFVDSAFKHGYNEDDFFEVLETGPLKLRSRRGLEGIYELLGRTHGGEYLHIAYRQEPDQTVVFHMRAMTTAEKARYRKR